MSFPRVAATLLARLDIAPRQSDSAVGVEFGLVDELTGNRARQLSGES